jgi:hypothetical protein
MAVLGEQNSGFTHKAPAPRQPHPKNPSPFAAYPRPTSFAAMFD